MPLALILPRGDQWYLLRKPLIRRDKRDTLSLLVQFLLKLRVPCAPCVCVCVCVCVFIKLHITTQSGPVILVILCHSHWSSRGGINDTYYENLCVCVCVCFLPIHSGHQVRWTYQPGSHRISHPPSFCGACLNFSREKDSAIPFHRRLWCRILCTNDLLVLHPLGIFVLFCFVLFLSEKNPVCRDRTHVPTCQKVTRYLWATGATVTRLLILLIL